MELGGKMINGECDNYSRDIRKTLGRIMNEASEFGFLVPGIRIICESTGIYHRRLLEIASKLGMQANLVHGEAVSKFRAIQFADHGKTDKRDPQAALTVAKVGRLIQHRKFNKQYTQLRELHRLVRYSAPPSESQNANIASGRIGFDERTKKRNSEESIQQINHKRSKKN